MPPSAKIGSSAPRVNVLGVGVDPLDLPSAVARVESWIVEGRKNFAIFRDVHGVMQCQYDIQLMAAHHAAGLVGTDGMPLVWLARRRVGRQVSRVYGPDFTRLFFRTTNGKGYRHFFYGSTPETIDKLIANLKMIAPDQIVAGTLAPPFRPLSPQEDEAIVTHINSTRPDIIWVGLSTPKQELWMYEHLGRVDAAALIGVGAAFDFISGNKVQAPRWVQRLGLEWLFRALTEPRRLGMRYLKHVPAFLVLVIAQELGLSRYRKP